MREPSDIVGLKLRLRETLRHKLENAAATNKRSMNSEILYRLALTLEPEFEHLIAQIEERRQQEYDLLEARELAERLQQNQKLLDAVYKIILEGKS